MRKLIIGVVCILMVLSCRQQSNNNMLSNIKPTIFKIKDPNEIYFNWDSVINIDSVIPLETTSKSGIGQFYKGLVHNNKIFMFDRRNHIGLVFNNDGRFIRKIGINGRGPQEYLEFRDFSINDDNIYVLDYQKIHCYDIETGQYQYNIKFHSDKGFNPSNLLVFDDNTYYLWNSNPDVWEPNKGKFYRLKKYKGDDVIAELFEYKYKTSDDNRFYWDSEGTYYMAPVDGDYNIYKISMDSIYNVFKLDFGNKALSSEEIDKLRNSGERNAYLRSNYFKGIYNIFEISNYIYFGCIGPKSYRYEGLINKETGEIRFGRWDYRKSPQFFYSDGKFLYGYYEPSSLIEMSKYTDQINFCFEKIPEEIQNLQIENNLVVIKVSMN